MNTEAIKRHWSKPELTARIKERLREMRQTQKTVAEKIDIPPAKVSAWLNMELGLTEDEFDRFMLHVDLCE